MVLRQQKYLPRHQAHARTAATAQARFRRLILEPLEERSLLTVITVTRLDDAVGTGDGITLREAILAANTNVAVDGSAAGQASPAIDSIVFQGGLTGTISLGPGGQLSISETVKIQGNGAGSTIIDAHGASRVFQILASGGDVTFDGVSITGGVDRSQGAGIEFNSPGLLTVQNSTIFGNSISTDLSPIGGGIVSSGAVNILNSTIRDNSVFTTSDLASAQGGGIFAGGAVTVTSSTISGNSVTAGHPTTIATGGGIQSLSAVRLTLSTISGNSVESPSSLSRGGGVEAPEIVLTHSTVTGNSASGPSGEGGGLFSSNMTIRNSIVAGNTASSGVAPDFFNFFGDPFAVQASLIGDNNGTGLTASATPDTNRNLIGTHTALIDAQLGPLTNNGGPTKTHAPLAGSPALNIGKIGHAQALLATPNLRALYKLDEVGLTAFNSSDTPGLDGMYIGGAPVSNSLVTGDGGNTLGDANSFNGSSDQVTLPSALVPAGGFTDFSLSFWLRTTQPAATGTGWFEGRGLVDGTSASTGSDFGTSQLNGKFAFGVGGADTTVQSSQTINDGQWHHVVATRVSSSGAMAVYVDGVLGGTATGPTGARTATTRLVMGSLQTGFNYFGGQLDEAAVFMRALSAGEVASLYQAEVPAGFDQRGVPFKRVSGLRDAGAYERQTLPGLVFQVSTAVDENDGNISGGNLSLREAIGLANGNAGGDTITFAPELDGQPILLTQGQLEIGESVAIQGNGAANTIIDAQQQSRVFSILSSGGDVTFDGLTVTNGKVTGGEGGGIWSQSTGALTVTSSKISGNAALQGGGIRSAGSVAVTSSTISGNSALLNGGGIFTNGSVTMIGSTISHNAAGAGGGGIRASGSVTATNSTISGNSAEFDGGGIYTNTAVTLFGSTVSGNSALNGNGGGIITTSSATICNSIVAGNSDTDDGGTPDLRVNGPLVVQASLIGDNNRTGLTPAATPDTNGNLIGTHAAPLDPKLAPLADNGGPTPTHALLPGSPAIDAGNNNLANDPGLNGIPGDSDDVPLMTDQRGPGFPRLINARRDQAAAQVDMGAFEYNSLLVTTKDDENDATYNPADLSLREAIAISNSTPVESITFADSLNGQTITLSLGELLVSKSVSITGPGADKLAISGGNGATQSRVFTFATGSGANTYALSGVTVKDGNGLGGTTGNGFGGAIRFVGADDRLSIRASVIRDSAATSGGGLYVDLGTADLTNVTVSGNSATFGGGLEFLEANATLTNVTVSGNHASDRGGGILSFASRANATSRLRLINSTVANNSSPTAAGIRNSTQNTALSAILTMGNSIVANNTGGGAQISLTGTGSTLTSLGHNITSDASGNLTGPGDLQNTDPRLAPLGDFGGALPVHALCTGFNAPLAGCAGASPALNAGDNALAKSSGANGVFGDSDDTAFVTDGRGTPFSRVVNATVDIGAFEHFVNAAPTCTVGPAQNTDDEKGLQTVAGWVVNCLANDPLQTASFSISTDKPELFTTPPTVDANGKLTFDPAPNKHGTAKVTVTIRDDGGTASDGIDRVLLDVLFDVLKPHPLFNAAETGARRGLDVTGSTSTAPDGKIVAQDALAIINYINAKGSGTVPSNSPFGPPYVDVTGDNQVVAEDVLKVINYINANPGQSEGESGLASTRPATDSTYDSILLLIADEIASQSKRPRKV